MCNLYSRQFQFMFVVPSQPCQVSISIQKKSSNRFNMRRRYSYYSLWDTLNIATLAALSKTVVAPLERIKIILQVQHVTPQISSISYYGGIIEAFRRIPIEQGLYSLWRGNMVSVIRCFPAHISHYVTRDLFSNMVYGKINPITEPWKYNMFNLFCGAVAGAISYSFLYPLDFARTRLAADLAPEGHRQYYGLYECLQRTIQTDGIKGIYRGYVVSIPQVVVFRAIYFGAFDSLEPWIPDFRKLSPINMFLVANAVTSLAGFAAHPFDTVRRRMMMQSGLHPNKRVYSSISHCWEMILYVEGPKALFKGGLCNFFRGALGATALIIYNHID